MRESYVGPVQGRPNGSMIAPIIIIVVIGIILGLAVGADNQRANTEHAVCDQQKSTIELKQDKL